jgi:phage tail protein X
MNRYVAKDGDRLDKVIYDNYKTLDVFNSVMIVNTHLFGKTVLSAGDIVHLPTIEQKPKVRELKSLWN